MVKLFLKNLWVLLVFATLGLQAQTTVSGQILDGDNGETLIGANVIISGTTVGTSTDIDGNFSLTSDQPLPWDLEISYTGFNSQNVAITGPTSNLNISMESSAILTDEVVVSASRRREKVQEAPASISVLRRFRTLHKLRMLPETWSMYQGCKFNNNLLLGSISK